MHCMVDGPNGVGWLVTWPDPPVLSNVIGAKKKTKVATHWSGAGLLLACEKYCVKNYRWQKQPKSGCLLWEKLPPCQKCKSFRPRL